MIFVAMTSPMQSEGVLLGELARLLSPFGASLRGDADVVVSGLHQDSRRVEPGDLFAARLGGKTSGLSFVTSALEAGAVALLVERGTAPSVSVPVLEVDNLRQALAFAAEAIYGHPSRALDVIGITGTNGKTTTSFLVESVLQTLGLRPARLGTLGFSFGLETLGGAMTTPEADDVSRFAARVRDAQGTHLVMEVSSHALSLSRVAGLRFKVAAFTNLTQDHLDFHQSMEEYARAKSLLFTSLLPECSVINIDDAFGRELGKRAHGKLIRVGRDESAEIRATSFESTAQGIFADVQTPWGEYKLASPLVGAHNLENLLVAVGIFAGLELDLARAIEALAESPQVPGRLERCDTEADDITVLVDYAHTPDALERVLRTVRTLTNGQVICVFGCGGDRDPAKRPKMGAAVARGADRAIITNDNPRSEDPQTIAQAIEPPLKSSAIAYEIELDRALAIERAVLSGAAGDLVLIAGKGHETYQIMGNETRDFDDRTQAKRALARRRGDR